MKKLIFTVSILIFLTGCTAGPTVVEIPSPDGSPLKKVKCVKNSSECFVAAGKSCNGGSYQVFDSESHAGGIWADALAGPATWFSFTYKCGPSDGKIPTFPFGGQQYTPPTMINQNTDVKVYN